MKRGFILLVFLVLSCAAAQDILYVGFRLAAATGLEEVASGVAPYLGLQVGVRALDPLELRVAYDVSLGLTYAQADLLYSQPLGDGLRGYTGLGLDLYEDGWNGARGYGVHATAGLEVRTGTVGFFAEAQPIYAIDLGAFRLRSSLGVNLHF